MGSQTYWVSENRKVRFLTCDLCDIADPNLHVRTCDICGREVCANCYEFLAKSDNLKDIFLVGKGIPADEFIVCRACLACVMDVYEDLSKVCSTFTSEVSDNLEKWAQLSLGENIGSNTETDKEKPCLPNPYEC